MTETPKSRRNASMSALPSLPRSQFLTSGEPGQRDLESDGSRVPRYRFLSPTEWSILARAVGGIRDSEQMAPVHPVSRWWSPKGLPPGLYRDVVHRRTVSFYYFHISSGVRWGLLVMQLFLGASLTALGSLSRRDGTCITILAAANTIIAGLLALLHNSGLPDRYRYDMTEFEEVEDYMRKLLTTGLVRADLTVDQVLAECYDLYHTAKATVEANMPATYSPSQALQAGRRNMSMVVNQTSTPPKLVMAADSDDGKGPAPKPGE
ncbi:hypothetical protein FZEAL_6029 [Fusarium zealandicum]|uniref:SMODS and SLOG-associating 2TM effector domain-containing protein n=1 Tax=Fusarium zealandicum TaxID=1053134 RepID=A0A8H4XJ85_9HYPO|nr:hypothetical protein FZEAL_6029 [Fusarium zealandicum]